MSILSHLIERANDFRVNGWELNRDDDPDSISDPHVILMCRIVIPCKEIDEDLWYGLDGGFSDPETCTTFYCHDFDGDDDSHWGSFTIEARTTDIAEVLDILRGEIEAMEKWLTAMPKQA